MKSCSRCSKTSPAPVPVPDHLAEATEAEFQSPLCSLCQSAAWRARRGDWRRPLAVLRSYRLRLDESATVEACRREAESAVLDPLVSPEMHEVLALYLEARLKELEHYAGS